MNVYSHRNLSCLCVCQNKKYSATYLPHFHEAHTQPTTPSYFPYPHPSRGLICSLMETNISQSSILQSLISIFLISLTLSPCHCQINEQFLNCSQPFECGTKQGNVAYPFWGNNKPGFCGMEGFEVECPLNQQTVIDVEDQRFQVLNVDRSLQVLSISRMDLAVNVCEPTILLNTTSALNQTRFRFPSDIRNLSLFYGCDEDDSNSFSCPSVGGERSSHVYYRNEQFPDDSPPNRCNLEIIVPVPSSHLTDLFENRIELPEAMTRGFNVEYVSPNETCSACERSNGFCGSDDDQNFVCFCPGGPGPQKCAGVNGIGPNRKIVIGFTAGFCGIAVTLFTCVIFRYKRKSLPITSCCMKRSKNDEYVERFIRTHGALSLKRYPYSDVKKMTSSFKDKLGQGGYGSVYKGKLLDSRLVAVKLLNTSKDNGQEFINEVASISRTSHVNIVSLLGFCCERGKRALIYEFMPNGSLGKFIHNNAELKAMRNLSCDKLYQIALGIARGLEYLHNGCIARILHLDIKPDNILLDQDFSPKISDFGLAKLCTRRESIMSSLEARGTIGYIAPELFSRNFGPVSCKADIYSYGMMVLEMAGGRKNIDVGVSRTSEIYFPHWIYKHVESGNEFVLHGVSNKQDAEIMRKMIIVGLWCIQTNPSDRPFINKVIEMLEGNVDALQIPPQPFFSSPERSPPPANDSTTATMSLQ